MVRSVGVIGLGIMGSAMARNLIAAGFEAVGCDVSHPALDRFAAAGGAAVATPAEVSARAGIVLISLPNAAALDAVVIGPGGLASRPRPGLIAVETSTIALADKERARDALARTGAVLLDCPLSGTGAQAATRDLVVLGSGEEAAFRACAEVFAGISRVQHYLGAFGNGMRMKLIANHLVAIHNLAAAEAFVLGAKAGIPAQTMYDVLKDSAGASRMFQVRGPMMVAGNYEPATATFTTFLKDIHLISSFAAGLGCPLPLFGTAVPYYQAAVAQGAADQDTAGLCAVLERMAGVRRDGPDGKAS